MSQLPDHELEELEDDSRVPPRPEEELADVERQERQEPAPRAAAPEDGSSR